MPTTRFMATGVDFVTPARKVYLSKTGDEEWTATVITYQRAGRAGTLLGMSAGALAKHIKATTPDGALAAAIDWLRGRYGAGLMLTPFG